MSDRRDLARGWLMKAASDLAAAELVVDGAGPYDTACFHAQQASEKALKALLAFNGLPVPRTHDLEELQRLCLGIVSLPALAGLDLTEATDYGVLVRYDLGFWPDQAEAADALLLAEQVNRIVLSALPAECRP
jgi:hypothetical protein